MLNTLPPVVKPHSPPPASCARKRGGQPSNRNAFKHGFYAEKYTSPIPVGFSTISKVEAMLSKDPDAVDLTLKSLQELVDWICSQTERTENTPAYRALVGLMNKAVKTIGNIKHARWLSHQPGEQLSCVARSALALIRLNFIEDGITRDTDSFRAHNKNSDFYSFAFQESALAPISDPPYPFLAPRQWRLIEPLLPPTGSFCRRGRPPSDPRELLDAAFWKIAHHALWQDLPSIYPKMLTCRRYYRRLFLSGRLATIYRVIYDDLISRGAVDLSSLVNQGRFSIAHNRLQLQPGCYETWQMRTALLFMQLGYQVYRRLCREIQREYRSGLPPLRLPGIRS